VVASRALQIEKTTSEAQLADMLTNQRSIELHLAHRMAIMGWQILPTAEPSACAVGYPKVGAGRDSKECKPTNVGEPKAQRSRARQHVATQPNGHGIPPVTQTS